MGRRSAKRALRLDLDGYRGLAVSDTLGRFRLDIDSPGVWAVESQRDGYIPETFKLYIECDDGSWGPEGVKPAVCPVPPAPLIIYLREWPQPPPEDSMIRGRVRDVDTGHAGL
jgi:hypothetical protein